MEEELEPQWYSGSMTAGPLAKIDPFPFDEEAKTAITTAISEKLGLAPESTETCDFLAVTELLAAWFKNIQGIDKKWLNAKAAHADLEQFRKLVPALRQVMEGMDSHTAYLLLSCLESSVFHRSRTDGAGEHRLPTDVENLVEYMDRAAIENWLARRDLAESFLERLRRELVALDAAVEMAKSVLGEPKRGRPPERWRIPYAVAIAQAFSLRLGRQPTATQKGIFTEDSCFESVLRVCFHSVGVETKDVHKTARAAVKQIREQEKQEK